MSEKTLKTVEVSPKCFDSLERLSKACNQTKKGFLDDLINAVDDIGSQFPQNLVILYTGNFNKATLHLNFIGKSTIESEVRKPTKEDEDRDSGIIHKDEVKRLQKNIR